MQTDPRYKGGALAPAEYRDLLAGFGPRKLQGVTIILRESRGVRNAVNVNKDGSRDRGIWQINDKAHPECSDACAFDPQCATRYAGKISNWGRNWKPWSSSGTVHPADTDVPLANADDAGLFGVGRGKGADTIAGDAIDAVMEVPAFLAKIASREFLLSAGKIIGGGACLLIGITQLGKVAFGVDVGTPLKAAAKLAPGVGAIVK